MLSPMRASPQNSSSRAIGSDSPLGSAHVLARNSNPYRPILAASWITGQGVSSRSSHSEAAGRTTSSANPCTQSRMSLRSWESSIENWGPARSEEHTSELQSRQYLVCRLLLEKKKQEQT